jgi:hypothetical protein
MDIELDATTRAAIVGVSLAEILKRDALNQILVGSLKNDLSKDELYTLAKEFATNQKIALRSAAGLARVMIECLLVDADTALAVFDDEIETYVKALTITNVELTDTQRSIALITADNVRLMARIVTTMLTETKGVNFHPSQLPTEVSNLFKEKD